MDLFFFLRFSKYLNCSAVPKDLLPNVILLFCLACSSQDMTIYSVLSAFTSRPIGLRATAKASVFCCIVRILPPIILNHQNKPEDGVYNSMYFFITCIKYLQFLSTSWRKSIITHICNSNITVSRSDKVLRNVIGNHGTASVV